MRQFLPVGEYRWLPKDEIESINWTEQKPEQDYGYIVECTLRYPDELHDSHESFPLAPERIDLDYEMLSPYSQECLKKYKPQAYKNHKTTKLGATFGKRVDYVCHYRNLALYLQQGMILEKVSRVIKFRQKPFLREYVDVMTERRKQAISIFEKNFFKLLINSVFGKFIENLRTQTNCVFVNKASRLARCLRNPAFDRWRIIGENLVVFYNKKKIVKMNKPYVIGFSVLDISKCHMFDLHYNHIKVAAPNASVCLTDTDSLLLYLPDMSKRTLLEKCKNIFDFSNYPKTHDLYDATRKMIPGYLKDENGGRQLIEVIGMKAKVYAFRTKCGGVGKKCKGVPKRIVKRDFDLSTYLDCLRQASIVRASSTRLQAKNFQMSLVASRKIGLTALDDKKYIWPCGIHTTSFYSKIVREGTTTCPKCHCTVEMMKNSVFQKDDDDE